MSVDGVEADGSLFDPIREPYWRTRGLSVGVGFTPGDGLADGGDPADEGLDRDWISRRREAIRSTVDCPLIELCAEASGEGLDRNEVGGRLGLTEGLDRSTEGVERPNEGAGRLGATEGVG